MAIFLPTILDLGLYYQKSKTQWVKKLFDLLQIVSYSDYICINIFQPKPHFKVVMYDYKLFDSYPHNHKHTRNFQKNFLALNLIRFSYLQPNFQIE